MNIWVTGMQLSSEQQKQLEERGHNVTILQKESDIKERDVSEIEVLVCQNVFAYRDVEDFQRLRVVQAVSAGLDRLPVATLKKGDIHVYNAGDTYAVPMAEWVVWQLLDFMKHGAALREKQQNRLWEKERRLRELSGKTAVLLGVGNVSKAIAKRLHAFEMRVIGVGRRPKEVPFVDRYVLMDQLYEVLQESDVVILALPLTDETYHLIDETAIAAMKEDAVLMNVARGAIIDEVALVNALREGKFFGVALDVFETEPIQPNHPFYEFDWVSITPHNSYVSDHGNRRLFQNILVNLGKENERPI